MAQTDLDNLRFNLNTMLFNKGLSGLHGHFIKEATPISKSLMKTIIKDETGLDGVSLYDSKYYIVDWSIWVQFIKKIFIDQMLYFSDWSDCDKYAKLFVAVASVLGMNSAGLTTGNVLDLDDNRTFRHGFNFIVYKVGSNFKVRCYEPQTDEDIIITGDNATFTRMNWNYQWDWSIF